MKLDGTIGNLWVAGVFIVAFGIGASWVEARRNPQPPLERYRRDGRAPWVAFWNLFDESVFTPEAVQYHRRLLQAIPVVAFGFALGWVILDLLW